MHWLSLPPDELTTTRAPARTISRHSGGTGIAADAVDMDRSPRLWRGGRSPAPTDRPEDAGLERLTPHRRAMPCGAAEAPLGQEGAELPPPGSKMAGFRADRGGRPRLWSGGRTGRSENATTQGVNG